MDVWSTIILVLNMLLLTAGWLLFQQAKSDLTARAAQVPVLAEIKELHKSISALLEQLQKESTVASAELEAQCREARDLLTALEQQAQQIAPGLLTGSPASSRGRVRKAADPQKEHPSSAVEPSASRHADVYRLADSGAAPEAIANELGCSTGEVELILNLRGAADRSHAG